MTLNKSQKTILDRLHKETGIGCFHLYESGVFGYDGYLSIESLEYFKDWIETIGKKEFPKCTEWTLTGKIRFQGGHASCSVQYKFVFCKYGITLKCMFSHYLVFEVGECENNERSNEIEMEKIYLPKIRATTKGNKTTYKIIGEK